MSCPKCGSWAVRADRSLGGRMVCGRCGAPLGGKVIPLHRPRRRGMRPATGHGPRLWWMALMALVGVSGLLAALQMGEEQPRPLPWERRGQELRGRLS